MQEEPHEGTFIPDIVDEQITQLKQSKKRSTANVRLLRDLGQAYGETQEENQAVERIHERLMTYTAKTLSPGEQMAQSSTAGNGHPQHRGIKQMKIHDEKGNKHPWPRRWAVLTAALIAMLVVGSLIAILQMTQNASQHAKSNIAQQDKQLSKVGAARKSVAPVTDSGMYLGLVNQVIKLDMQTHKALWRFTITSDPNDIPAFRQPRVYIAPVVANGYVYFTAQNGRLYALDAQSGKLRWERTFQQYIGHQYVVNGVLYMSTRWNDEHGAINDVYALDAANGTTKVKYKATGQIAGIFDGVMYLNNTHTLTAIRLTDGSQLWQTQIDANQALNANVYLHNDTLYASSMHTGEKSVNEPEDSYVYTLDRKSGKITWRSPVMDGFVFDIAVGDDGRVYCGAQNHYLYAFDPRLKMYQEVWKYHTIVGHVYPAPIVYNGIVYAGQSSAGATSGNNDNLVALDAKTGTQKWITPLNGYTGIGDNEPLVLHDGVIYIGVGIGIQGIAVTNGNEVVTLPTDALISKKGVGQNASLVEFAITIVS